MLINIPFAGFYESIYSDIVDSWLERLIENREEEESDSEYYPEEYYPEELRADYSDSWRHFDYTAAYLAIAKDYAESFGELINDWAKELDDSAPDCGLQFSRLDSPKYYNFSTDAIDCDFSESFVQWLFTQSAKDDHAGLQKTLIRRHKSRDGFISYYSHYLADWLEKPFLDWDYHELRSLLETVFPQLASDSDWNYNIYYPLAESDYTYCDSAMDWESFNAAILESRAEKLAQWIESDESSAIAWVINNPAKFDAIASDSPDIQIWESSRELPYRCSKTPDLFEGVAR